MERIILIFSFFLFLIVSPLSAQNSKAKNILDKTAALIQKSGNMEISFSASSFMQQKQKGNLTGTLYLKGKKIHIVSTNILSWFDGKTLWTLSKANNEVNVSIPSLHEKETMDPYLFIDLYKKDYNYNMKETTLRGMDCYEVSLTEKDPKQAIKEIIITIDKKSNLPICIRLREGIKYWVRISIYRCKINQNYSDSMFKFNNKDFPKVEVIDIR